MVTKEGGGGGQIPLIPNTRKVEVEGIAVAIMLRKMYMISSHYQNDQLLFRFTSIALSGTAASGHRDFTGGCCGAGIPANPLS